MFYKNQDKERHTRTPAWLACLLVAISALVSWGTLGAETQRVHVLYPVLSEPYASVFDAIMRGIERNVELPVVRVALRGDSNSDIEAIRATIDKEDRVVALGGRSIQLANELMRKTPTIIGAVVTSPEKVSDTSVGVSLTPDPMILFSKLRFFAPNINEVIVIYRPGAHDYIIELAKRAASKHGLSLKGLPADDMLAAANHYKELLGNGIPPTSALWLMRDASLVDEKALVPFILEQAWKKNLVVFSSNPNHVARGALFTLFPDNEGLGKQLGALINDLNANRKLEAAILPLRAVRTAVNLRTAEHLGLEIDPSNRDAVQLTFPTR